MVLWYVEIEMSRWGHRLMEIVRRAIILEGMGPGDGLGLGLLCGWWGLPSVTITSGSTPSCGALLPGSMEPVRIVIDVPTDETHLQGCYRVPGQEPCSVRRQSRRCMQLRSRW